MISSFYGNAIRPSDIRQNFDVSQRGMDLNSMVSLAGELELKARALKVPLEKLKNLRMPLVLHWDLDHFVVLERVRGQRALVHDPAGVSQWIDQDELSGHFTGIALEFQPSAGFTKSSNPPRAVGLRDLIDGVSGLGRSIAQIAILTLILQIYVITYPFYMQLVFDEAVPRGDRGLLNLLALGFILLLLFNALASVMRSLVLMVAGTTLSHSIFLRLADHLFALPVAWFRMRRLGDILASFSAVAPIQSFLTQASVGVLIDGLMALFLLVIMLSYSVLLTSITILSLSIYALLRVFLFFRQRAVEEQAFVTSAIEKSHFIETVKGVATLRVNRKFQQRLAQWNDKLIDVLNNGIRASRLGIVAQTGSSLILGIGAIASIWFAGVLMLEGDFSVGMVFAFLAYRSQFSGRASALIEFVITWRLLSVNLEKIGEIALQEPDIKSTHGSILREEEELERIELRDVGFRYGSDGPVVLDNLSFAISPGETVGINGASGAGKSTFVSIMTGLQLPSAGEIYINGRKVHEEKLGNLGAHATAVFQEDTLFTGTIAENISFFEEPGHDQALMLRCSLIAGIHHEIERMPLGYLTPLSDMGSTISGGQRQRLIIARALYKRPKLLILDEATSYLGVEQEAEILAKIAEEQLALVIISHRPETTKSVDRLLTLNLGNFE